MKYGICLLSLIPMRIAPKHESEMISQLLFGEDFQIIKEENDWLFIENLFDKMQGWIERKMTCITNEIKNDTSSLIIQEPFVRAVLLCDKSSVFLCGGSRISAPKDNHFRLLDQDFKLESMGESIVGDVRTILIKLAKRYLHAPYLWGGRSYFGIDCSGFVQVIFKMINISLPRNSAQQAEKGQLRNSLKDCLPGDLAFFANETGKIVHVGILLSKDQIIHASGQVRIDSIDEHGIFNKDLNSYTHSLHVIKSILP